MSHFKHLSRAGKLNLERSIAKWQDIVDGGKEDLCPLCQHYKSCTWCPITRHVGNAACHGTPYYQTSGPFIVRPEGDQDMLACLVHIYLGDDEYRG